MVMTPLGSLRLLTYCVSQSLVHSTPLYGEAEPQARMIDLLVIPRKKECKTPAVHPDAIASLEKKSVVPAKFSISFDRDSRYLLSICQRRHERCLRLIPNLGAT